MMSEREKMKSIVSLYSRLFTLPSMKSILIFSTIFSLFVGFVVGVLLEPEKVLTQLIIEGLLFGIIVFLLPLQVSGYVTQIIGQKRSKILSLRRSSAISFISLGILGVICLTGAILSKHYNNSTYFLSSFLFGAGVIVAFRLLILQVISRENPINLLTMTFSQPILCIFFYFLVSNISHTNLIFTGFYKFLIVSVVLMIGVIGYLRLINTPLVTMTGIDGLTFFRGFLIEWAEEAEGEELEKLFSQLGFETNLPISVTVFRSLEQTKEGDEFKALLIIPSIHPGPFKHTCSSDLPYKICEHLEKQTKSMVFVAHGPSTHGLNLASSEGKRKVITEISKNVEKMKEQRFYSNASKFLRVIEEDFTIGAQIFGNFCILSATRAPKAMDDIPFEIGEEIIEKAAINGVNASVIDLHNSLEKEKKLIFKSREAANSIKKAASNAIEKILKEKMSTLKIGVARIHGKQIGELEEGIGEMGISAMVVETQEQRMVYVLVDGNNMVRGLREKIISKLIENEFDSAEVMTTDSHTVNAVSLDVYNPVGKFISHETIINCVTDVAAKALENIEQVEVLTNRMWVKCKIVGENNINNLIQGTRISSKLAKRAAPLIFGLSGLLSLVLLMII